MARAGETCAPADDLLFRRLQPDLMDQAPDPGGARRRVQGLVHCDFLVYVTTHELNMLIGDGELYRLFFRWRSSEAKLTRRQRIRLLTRLNRVTEANPIEAFSELGSPAHSEADRHFTAARFAARRTVGACLMGCPRFYQPTKYSDS